MMRLSYPLVHHYIRQEEYEQLICSLDHFRYILWESFNIHPQYIIVDKDVYQAYKEYIDNSVTSIFSMCLSVLNLT